MGKEKYNKEELIRLLIHEGKSYKEVAAMSEMSKVTDYTSKNAPITLFQDAEEVARFKATGNKKRLIDYMKFTDRLHNR